MLAMTQIRFIILDGGSRRSHLGGFFYGRGAAEDGMRRFQHRRVVYGEYVGDWEGSQGQSRSRGRRTTLAGIGLPNNLHDRTSGYATPPRGIVAIAA